VAVVEGTIVLQGTGCSVVGILFPHIKKFISLEVISKV